MDFHSIAKNNNTCLKEQSEKYLSDIRLFRYYKIDKLNHLNGYIKNLQVSEKVFSMISVFEIILRNKIHGIFMADIGNEYLSNPDPNIFNNRQINDIKKAYKNNKTKNIEIKDSKVLSLLTLGFWVESLKTDYIWFKYLHKIYSTELRRKYKYAVLRKMIIWVNKIRNKIAHHERILKKRGVNLIIFTNDLTFLTLSLIDENDKEFYEYIKRYFEEAKKEIERLAE